MKPNPRGLVSLSGGVQDSVETVRRRPTWTSPCVSIVRIRVPWANIEPSRGVFDFSIVDAAIDMAAQNGKLLSVTVGQMGFNTPQWVYDEGVESFTCTNPDQAGTMPLPWDATYLEISRAFALTFGGHCDSEPLLAYVQIQGYARSGELYCTSAEPDNTNFIAAGCLTGWLSGARRLTRYYMDSFHTTPCFVALAKPFLYAEGLQTEKDFASWGKTTYPRRFGVMSNSLGCNSNIGYYPNEAVNIYRPSGFQMVCASRDVERLGGTLEAAIDNGISLGGQFIEVYQPDIVNPAYQDMLIAKNNLLRG